MESYQTYRTFKICYGCTEIFGCAYDGRFYCTEYQDYDVFSMFIEMQAATHPLLSNFSMPTLSLLNYFITREYKEIPF